jgi:hypothetical protein
MELISLRLTTVFARHHKLLANPSTIHASHKPIAIGSVHQFHSARISRAVRMRNMVIFASMKYFAYLFNFLFRFFSKANHSRHASDSHDSLHLDRSNALARWIDASSITHNHLRLHNTKLSLGFEISRILSLPPLHPN